MFGHAYRYMHNTDVRTLLHTQNINVYLGDVFEKLMMLGKIFAEDTVPETHGKYIYVGYCPLILCHFHNYSVGI